MSSAGRWLLVGTLGLLSVMIVIWGVGYARDVPKPIRLTVHSIWVLIEREGAPSVLQSNFGDDSTQMLVEGLGHTNFFMGGSHCVLGKDGTLNCQRGGRFRAPVFHEVHGAEGIRDLIGIRDRFAAYQKAEIETVPHACGLDEKGRIACAYPGEDGPAFEVLAETEGLRNLVVAGFEICAVDQNDEALCFDPSYRTAKSGRDLRGVKRLFKNESWLCAELLDGSARCRWYLFTAGLFGSSDESKRAGWEVPMAPGAIGHIASTGSEVCVLREDSWLDCWEFVADGVHRAHWDQLSGRPKKVKSIDGDNRVLCAIDLESRLLCWEGADETMVEISLPSRWESWRMPVWPPDRANLG